MTFFQRGKHKFGAKPITVDGIRFDSTAEANRWFALRTLEKNDVISDLQRQVIFPLTLETQHGTFKRKYVADFVYTENGKRVVEDVKGMPTETYKIKRDLMLVLHGITILETGKGRTR